MNPIFRAVRWAAGEAWEKINFSEKWREIVALGKKYGRRFAIAAFLWECIEDLVFPYLAWRNGLPQLIPFFFVMHFEPLVYPAFFWAFRMWDRAHGLEPWEPQRYAQSSNVRSIGKVGVYLAAAQGWYVALLQGFGYPQRILIAYIFLMAAFGFVHERIWHDSNYGIGDDGAGDLDHVFMKRVLGKTVPYSIVSTTILASLFRVAFDGTPWVLVLACQGVGIGLYFTFEAVWSHSKWGVSATGRMSPVPTVEPPLVGQINADRVTVVHGNNYGNIDL